PPATLSSGTSAAAVTCQARRSASLSAVTTATRARWTRARASCAAPLYTAERTRPCRKLTSAATQRGPTPRLPSRRATQPRGGRRRATEFPDRLSRRPPRSAASTDSPPTACEPGPRNALPGDQRLALVRAPTTPTQARLFPPHA